MKPSTLAKRIRSNDQIAQATRAALDAARVTAVTVVGPAGSGKTSMIEALLLRLDPKVRAAAIVGNLAADRQIARLGRHGYQALALMTDNLAAHHVRDALSQLDLHRLDLLFIEADSNASSPIAIELGHHLRVGVFSAAGGDDKATEFPSLVTGSDLVILTKTDLLPFVTFDLEAFRADVRRLKPGLDVIHISAQHNKGIDTWLKWLEFHAPAGRWNTSAPRMFYPFTNWFRQ